MYDKERREYQQEWAQRVPLLVRRGLCVVQERKVGARGRRAVCECGNGAWAGRCHQLPRPTSEEGQGVCGADEDGVRQGAGEGTGHHGWGLQLRSRRRGAKTEVDREVRLFVEEKRLQDVSYSGAPGPSHYLAPEGSTPSRIDAVYADPRWIKGVTAGHMVGRDEMQDRKGHCPLMVTVHVKLGEPGDEEGNGQQSDKKGVNLPPLVQ